MRLEIKLQVNEMRDRKYFTVREWNRFKNKDSFDMQDMLCQRYDVILTDYKTKREKVFSALKKINLRNFDRGVSEFSKLVKTFGGSMDQLTREINSQKSRDSGHTDLMWGKSGNSVPIWSDSRDDFGSQHKDNLEKIWGKRK